MHEALLIAGKDLRLRFRDRSAVVLGFVAPVMIATVMSFAFGATDNFHVSVVVADADHGAMGSSIVAVLRSKDLRDLVHLTVVSTRSAAAARVKAGTADAGLVVPAGFTDSIGGSTPGSLGVLTSVDKPLAGEVVQSIATSFTAQIDADRLSVATALRAGAPTDRLDELVAAAAAGRIPVSVVGRPTGSRTLKAISYYAPGMGIFFLFFAISFTARGWFVESRQGTLQRMAAATSPSTILVGKALSVFVYGSASMATMAVVTSVVFHADWGGPGPAAALIAAMVFSVVCLTALVIVVSRTERQAEGLAAMVVFGLALLGGNFVFVSAAPPALRRMALFTPNGWALRGFVDLATGPHTMAAVWGPLAGIGAFSGVVILITAALSRRMVLP